jgi:hypothetical protein
VSNNLQEFGAFRTLGWTFRMWFRNLVPFTLMAAVLCVPSILLIAKADPSTASTTDDLVDMYFTHPLYVTIGLSTLLVPLLAYRVIRQLEGTWISLSASMQAGFLGILPALILTVMMNVLQRIPLGGIAGAVIMCIWFVAAPAAVAERLGPVAALGRSADLTRGRRWNIFGLSLLVGAALLASFFVWIYPAMDAAEEDLTALRRPAIFCAIATAIVYQFTGIAEAIGYVLLRREKEGHEGVVPEQLATAIVLPPRRPADQDPGGDST